MKSSVYDVVIIGSGSGGTACALRCADRGKKVLLVEKRSKDGPGGTCVNRGCIPTKVLMRSVKALEDIKHAKQFGIEIPEYKVNFKRLMAGKNKVQKNLAFGLKQFVIGGRDNIELLTGAEATITAPHTVTVTTKDGALDVEARMGIVIATGSEPSKIPAFNIDGSNVITSDEALTLKQPPVSMLVIGAGAIGMELSTFYNAMGTEITLVEMMDDVAPLLNDPQMSALVKDHLSKEGMKVYTGVGIDKVEVVEDGKVRSTLSNGETIETEKVLVGIGRTSNLEGLGLEKFPEIAVEKGKIRIDKAMRTGVESMYAVGDIVAGPQLSHKAQNEGVTAAENMMGNPVELDYAVLPWVIFGLPELAKVGLSEADARDRGLDVMTGYLDMTANEKATCMQETTGAIKLTIDTQSRKIIGAILFCTEADALIGELAMAVKMGTTVEEMAGTIHAHPTLTEAVMECAKHALGLGYQQ